MLQANKSCGVLLDHDRKEYLNLSIQNQKFNGGFLGGRSSVTAPCLNSYYGKN